jgi:tetratricopeptide (TPR) repeat protein
MMKRKILNLFLFFFLSLHLFSVDYSVGEILSFSGEVFVDHFGNGSFIEAREGDSLYKNSIVKTGAQSKATIKVMELKKDIPPLSELSIANVIALESKKKNTGWFDSLMNVINQASDAFFEGEENVDLASRGEDEILGKDELFAYETEEDIRPDYLQELDLLLEINTGDSHKYSRTEMDLKKGLCYFGLAQYQDALKHLSAAYSSLEKKDEPFFTDNLILMLGITHYFLAEYPESIQYFTKFLFRSNVPEYKPFAYWLLLDSLILSGREEEAGILKEKAEQSLKNSILGDRFSVFLKEMS